MLKIISDGGMPSKNFPNYTETSFLIACNKKYVSGLKVDIYITKDLKFVLANEEVLRKIGIDEAYIQTHTYKHLKKINYGSKIKAHYLVDLETLFNICNRVSYIIINICNKYLNDKEINSLNNILIKNNSKKLLVASSSTDILSKLNNKLKKGLFISNKNDWEYSYSFYITDEVNINEKVIQNKLKNDVLIFIYCKNKCDIFNEYNNDKLFIISPYFNYIYFEK